MSAQDMAAQVGAAGASLCVVNFEADWCAPCAHMNDVFLQLARAHPRARFLQVAAEEQDEVAEKHSIEAVPSFVFLRAGHEVDRLTGADAPSLAAKVERWAAETTAATSGPQDGKAALHARLAKLIAYAPVMLFMKGTPDEPQCGFSRQAVALMKKHNANFSAFDILSDPEVRAGLKEYSNWKTYPQLYVNGELIGGLDIMKELDEEGELSATLAPNGDPKAALKQRLEALVKQAPVMLFMKGRPDEPRCGFSNKIVALLNDQGVNFSSFDILSDPEVRAGLKEFGNWPTYPQLYAEGELVGGLDIVKELVDNDELRDALPATAFS